MKTTMSEKEAIKRLKEAGSSFDNEAAHATADRILLEFLEANGHEKVAKAFREARDEAGFWYA